MELLSSAPEKNLLGAFLQFASIFGKEYKTSKEFRTKERFFKEAHRKILKHNNKRKRTSTVGHNEFSDWSEEELKKLSGLKTSDLVSQ